MLAKCLARTTRWVEHFLKHRWCSSQWGRKEMFYLTMHSTHFIYGYMVKDHSDSERGETCWCHMGYSFRLTARVPLYAPSHRQDSTYHDLCYTSCGELTGTTNSSMGSLPMKDQSDDPLHHEQTLLPQSYISLPEPMRFNCVYIFWKISYLISKNILSYIS